MTLVIALSFVTFTNAQAPVEVMMAGTTDVNGTYTFAGTNSVNGISYNFYTYDAPSGTTYQLDAGVTIDFFGTLFYGWRIYDQSTPPTPSTTPGAGTFYYSTGNSTGINSPNMETWSVGPLGTVDVPAFLILPVEISRFTADEKGSEVSLNWTTASEINNEGFEIERSTDGKTWTYLDFVAGKGTSQAENNYQYLDETPESGMNYYRLRQMDFDGRWEYSEVVSIKMEGANTVSFTAFPNPSKGEVAIKIEHFNGEGQLSVFRNDGALILTQDVRDVRSTIDLSTYPNGIYTVQIQTPRQVLTQKVVKF